MQMKYSIERNRHKDIKAPSINSAYPASAFRASAQILVSLGIQIPTRRCPWKLYRKTEE